MSYNRKNIKIWAKGYEVKKALAFTKDQLLQYHNIPYDHNPKYLTIKAYSIIAVSFAARSSETHLIYWEDIEKLMISIIKSAIIELNNQQQHRILLTQVSWKQKYQMNMSQSFKSNKEKVDST